MAKKPAFEVKIGQKKYKVNDIQRIIVDLPKEVQPKAAKFAAETYVKYFRMYPPYKHVTRANAYPDAPAGPGWFSDKQRKYVMAKIREGRIDPGFPHRTGKTQRAWQVTGSGTTQTIRNTAPAAPFLHSDYYRARQPKMVGWQTVTEMQKQYEDDVFADVVDYIDKEIIAIFKRI